MNGTRVHVLRAPAAPTAPPDAIPHLLIHGLGGSGCTWLDVISPLRAYGPVIAPDLPGCGETEPHRPDAAKAEVSAEFVDALTAVLGLDRVIVHGVSLGALVAVLFADLAPERVERLVLVGPALPGSAGLPAGWRPVGHAALSLAAPVGRLAVRLPLRQWWHATGETALINLVRRFDGRPASPGEGAARRRSPELAALEREVADSARAHPWRLDNAVTAWASAVASMYVDPAPVHAAIERLRVPTLVAWGADDLLVNLAVIKDLAARRPDWAQRTFPGVGHMPVIEVPDDYVAAVGAWLPRRAT